MKGGLLLVRGKSLLRPMRSEWYVGEAPIEFDAYSEAAIGPSWGRGAGRLIVQYFTTCGSFPYDIIPRRVQLRSRRCRC